MAATPLNKISRPSVLWLGSQLPWVNSLLLNNFSLIVTTIAVFCFPLCTSSAQYVCISIVFSLSISTYISLTSIILVDMLGLDKLTNAFGLLILFRGVAAIIGSPVAGMVDDSTSSYLYPFFMASGFFCRATVASFITPMLKSCSPQEEQSVVMDGLKPIDKDKEEGEGEDEEGGEDHNIPEIVETAPSPVEGQPPMKPILEIKQIESVL